MGHSGTGLKFSVTIDLQIFKALFVQTLKKSQNTYFGPKIKEETFSNFTLYSKGRHFRITRFDILIYIQ